MAQTTQIKIASRMYCGRFEWTASKIVDGWLSVGVGETPDEASENLGKALDRPDLFGTRFFSRKAERSDYADIAA